MPNFLHRKSPWPPSTQVHQAGLLRDGLDRLFSLSPALLCIAGTDGYFKLVNPAFLRTLGRTEADLLSRPFIDFVHPDDRRATLNELDKLSSGLPAVHFENRYRHQNGHYRWLLWNANPVAEKGLLYATALDITDRKKAESDLKEKTRRLVENRRRRQSLVARLAVAEETERRRIARGLHDDVGQTLLEAKLTLGAMLERELPSDGTSWAQQLQALLDHAILRTRTLSFELASMALYEVGLRAALQSLCQRAEEKSGIRFHPPVASQDNSIPVEKRVILYRAGRELIRNVIKHSKARTARLSLSVSRQRIRLTVEDDGCGLDDSKKSRHQDAGAGFGLFSIEQELEPIRGRFEIAGSKGSGTRAVVTIPLETSGAAT